MHWHRIILVSPLVNPAGDKGILANPVTLKRCFTMIMRSGFKGIYDMKRGATEVRFDDQFEPMKFGMPTYNMSK